MSCSSAATLIEADKITEVCARAAKAAGTVQLEARGKVLNVDRHLDHDIKLEVDRLSEAAALEEIRRLMPEAPIRTEEGGEISGTGQYVWIIDPLDGTMNYFYGQHHYCSCIACYRLLEDLPQQGLGSLGVPVAGAVYAAGYDELFLAGENLRAECNGKSIHVSAVDALKDAIITTSFASREPAMSRMKNLINDLVYRCKKLRIQGSCGLDICAVASGRLSALYQSDVRCWDFAASRTILESVGGKIFAEQTDVNRWDVLACAPGIYEELKALVLKYE